MAGERTSVTLTDIVGMLAGLRNDQRADLQDLREDLGSRIESMGERIDAVREQVRVQNSRIAKGEGRHEGVMLRLEALENRKALTPAAEKPDDEQKPITRREVYVGVTAAGIVVALFKGLPWLAALAKVVP